MSYDATLLVLGLLTLLIGLGRTSNSPYWAAAALFIILVRSVEATPVWCDGDETLDGHPLNHETLQQLVIDQNAGISIDSMIKLVLHEFEKSQAQVSTGVIGTDQQFLAAFHRLILDHQGPVDFHFTVQLRQNRAFLATVIDPLVFFDCSLTPLQQEAASETQTNIVLSAFAIDLIGREIILQQISEVVSSVYRNNDHPSLVFNPPVEIEIGERVSVIAGLSVSITPDELIEELESRLEGRWNREGLQDGVEVTGRIRAALSGEEGFTVIPIPPEVQGLQVDDPTIWRWNIEATNEGRNRLALSIYELVTVDGNETAILMASDAKLIEITESWYRWAVNFVQDNWRWLWATILVPLMTIFWGWIQRRQKPRSAARSPIWTPEHGRRDDNEN